MYSLGITFLHLFCQVVDLSHRVCDTGRTTISAVSQSGFSVVFLVLSIFEGLFALVYALIEKTLDSIGAILLGEVDGEHEPRTVIYSEMELPPMNEVQCIDTPWMKTDDEEEESAQDDWSPFC